MIIGISGKIGSGKDTVAKIAQKLLNESHDRSDRHGNEKVANWQIKKFGYKLKQIVSILTGLSIEDLESEEIKCRKLGKEWNNGDFRVDLTVRDVMQKVGTECMRDSLHPDIWVNALFVDYWSEKKKQEPDWIISDVRFPNELRAIERKGGIILRVERKLSLSEWQSYYKSGTCKDNSAGTYRVSHKEFMSTISRDSTLYSKLTHPSETSLDHYTFAPEYIIHNYGDLTALAETVELTLKQLKLIK